MIKRFYRLFHTVKYLKFEQIFFRLKYRVIPVSSKFTDNIVYKVRKWNGFFSPHLEQSVWKGFKVQFLSQKGLVANREDWNDDSYSKLWLYNLHYFDDLNALNSSGRLDLQREFIDRWIDDNPPLHGNGWEPYPLSLRIVNWTKWFSRSNQYEERHIISLGIQGQALMRQLEFHILGNHLFANAKALIFLGTFLKGGDGDRFLFKGLEILDREIPEQFLSDGGHFELSPMYHSILLWDLLELIELSKMVNIDSLKHRKRYWEQIAVNALNWLSVMCHSDSEISFFNDSALNIAKKPQEIFLYAEKLGLQYSPVESGLTTLSESGYSRIETELYTIIFDHGHIGPDYLPGHAHADSLSFELSVGNERVFVNSGTSLYGTGVERLRQRKTAAHNTLVIEESDSSEVWSGFRVARRAYGSLLSTELSDEKIRVVAAHDGYKRLSKPNIHQREIICSGRCIKVLDSLTQATRFTYHLHLHPDIKVVSSEEKFLVLRLLSGIQIIFESELPIRVEESSWHPGFGVSIKTNKITIESFNRKELNTTIRIIG